jgi:lysophospholipase L1-like esterase
MLGTNDATIGEPVWIYLGSLTQIVLGLFDLGVGEVVLMTPPPHPSTNTDIQDLIAGYVAGIIGATTGLCASISGVRCGPNVFELLDPALDFAPSNVHPNATGHAKIAGALFDTLVAIPEPSTASLLALGLVGIAVCRRRLHE